jgi:hypothetical protein
VEATIEMETEGEANEARKRARPDEFESQSHGADSSPMRQMDARDSRGPALPKRVACTHCRQSKVRSNTSPAYLLSIPHPPTVRLTLFITVEM